MDDNDYVIQETSALQNPEMPDGLILEDIILEDNDKEESEVQKQISILDKTDFKKSVLSKNDFEGLQPDVESDGDERKSKINKHLEINSPGGGIRSPKDKIYDRQIQTSSINENRKLGAELSKKPSKSA